MRKGYVLKKIVILVMILALPGFLYYLLTAKGKNRYKPLSFYGPKVVAKTGHKFHGKYIPDTIYHKLGDFNLVDQNGRQVSFKNFDKKLFVASFFYTNCPQICTTVNKNISELVYAYRKNPMVYFTSITVDPARDTPPVLKKYSSQFEATNKWLFLSGDTATTYNLARNGFLVNAVQKSQDDFIYSDKLILIDAEKRIRGYYNGTNAAEITKLNDEIKVLIAEELRKVDKALY
ncbi:SCO family protein [Mucilaginibacter terrigena]|uniref:SCO family protein n=1 Tax=Mucilaginibacter terrigena TaxID=2492395 RepID=A0A4Q5LJU1_9SPHI|nr:SCO family protein [Mucilaginibacter terrigena]RYU87322.1 SCO family protein [Mucilaginibacter terrigena]